MDMIKYLISVLIVFCVTTAIANTPVVIYDGTQDVVNIGSSVGIYEDNSSLTVDQILKMDSFKLIDQQYPNLGITSSSFWIQFEISNTSDEEALFLQISNPLLNELDFYEINDGISPVATNYGDIFPYSEREFNHQNFLLDINVPPGKTQKYLLKLKSWEQISLSIELGKKEKIYESNLLQDLVYGVFFGVILALMFYNLFIFITVKDKSYLFYVIYILFIGLTQATLQGYPFRFLWPDLPEFTNHSLIIFPAIAGIAVFEFMKLFMKTKKYTPYLHKGLNILSLLYIIAVVCKLLGYNNLSFKIVDLNAVVLSIYAFVIAITISVKGYRPAKFFLLSWSIFFLGVIGFVLRNEGVLPSNDFTNYTMSAGTALEVLLLSFALADRINIFRKEKEDAQEKTVELLIENETIIKDQNIILERKVEERTDELNTTLVDLKQAQAKLVDAEKMSSLGQLTAGIAHEINNPINFVSSNITPLRQDIEDVQAIIKKYEELEVTEDFPGKLKEIELLKEELDYDYLKTELTSIIDGIEDGARRTTEIVSGLRNFSRLDEGELKKVDLNQGIESTMFLINNKLNGINTEIELGDLPDYECNPGKINQLVMNLVDNAIYAIEKKEMDNAEGLIKLTSSVGDNKVVITVIDNGIGISKENTVKLYDPFFTTKDVGEGSGLGLSIVRGIVDAHGGNIIIESKEGEGTQVKVELPLNN